MAKRGIWRNGLALAAVLAGVIVCGAGVSGAAPLGSFVEFSSGLNTGSAPADATLGADGNVWFTDQGTTKALGEITPSGTILEFTLPGTPAPTPNGLVADPGGDIWFAAHGTFNGVEKFDPATKQFTPFPGTATGSSPRGIVLGPDGNIWFTDDTTTIPSVGTIGVLCLTTTALCPPGDVAGFVVHEFGVAASGGNAGSSPKNIVAGADGKLWFADTGTIKAIGEVNPATHAAVERSSLNPGDITPGPDGNIWFTDRANSTSTGSAISLVCLTQGPHCSASDAANHVIPTPPFPVAPGSTPEGLAVGPDGKLWFSDDGTKSIGSIDTATGTTTEYSIATIAHPAPKPTGITAGSDGNMWFADKGGTSSPAAIGRFGVDQLMLEAVTITPVVGIGFSGAVATGTDADPSTTGSAFTCTIDWGDGSPVDTACTVTGPTGGQFAVDGGHTYSADGAHSVTVTLTYVDSPTSTVSTTSTANVADALTAHRTTCDGTFGGSGHDVVVPRGANCTLLAGTQVSGNVEVQKGGALDDQGANIGHDLHADNADWVEIGGGGSIGHDLHVEHLAGAPSGGDNALCDTTVGGNVEVRDNGAAAPIDIGDLGACTGGAGLSIGRDLHVDHNGGAVTIGGNTVGGNLEVQDNRAKVTVTGNAVNRDIHVHNNNGGIGSTLTGNTAGGNCELQHDNPKIAGSGNSASGHQDTCNATA